MLVYINNFTMDKVITLILLILVSIFSTALLNDWFNSQQTDLETKSETKIENFTNK